jgi:Predicted dehydrogenases and related proteins
MPTIKQEARGASVWLIGSGGMAMDYARVLTALDTPTVVIGRGADSARMFRERMNQPVVVGGVAAYLATRPEIPRAAIISIGVEELAHATKLLLDYGVTRLLVEKPGALDGSEIRQIAALAEEKHATVLIAYNRRFYASTLRAQSLIARDGGVRSMHFEFTEWGHLFRDLVKPPGVLDALFLGNSTHVVDLAFFLGGTPVDLATFTAGGMPWHRAASVFAGAGRTDRDVLFSYQANWDAPGRWGLEVLTSTYRLVFRPMESLQVMRKGSVKVEPEPLEDHLDRRFKPGLHEQVRRFLVADDDGFCTVQEQQSKWDLYCRIAGYDRESRVSRASASGA